ncbi:glycosyltransferase family 2 protein [Leptodesmis sichuanensis]|uniref:glycosyltransferase family 2 protein n=1 Tax=Leptodesmis sichuanensis TaxID=2906798 RepID=UPI001F38C396|nr:glycosyltransferase family A protein [Leptodesmis sichuanensis]UIE37800.1 glycosyltransferase family 2 protein [Leptodesmis sichuanensis A121]
MTLPSFSIVLETENLANADLEGLTYALASLVHQDLSPEQANEVILIDSGDAPPELLGQLCDRYPWIKVHAAAADTGYYKAKMLGAELATGEIIVYADSDCLYEPHWLRTILTTFAENPQIQIVAGETTTRGRGPYGTAMALVYIFPQFSGKTELTPTHQYFLNNVAFRRQFLLDHPIPAELPLYRGNCVVHGENLQREGHVIWLHPQARATHAPPSDLSHFFWRFLLIGHDYYWQKKLIPNPPSPISNPQDRDPTASSFTEKVKIFRDRMARLLHNNPRHALYFPFAIPIILVAALLIYVGYLITLVSPDYLVKTDDRILE